MPCLLYETVSTKSIATRSWLKCALQLEENIVPSRGAGRSIRKSLESIPEHFYSGFNGASRTYVWPKKPIYKPTGSNLPATTCATLKQLRIISNGATGRKMVSILQTVAECEIPFNWTNASFRRCVAVIWHSRQYPRCSSLRLSSPRALLIVWAGCTEGYNCERGRRGIQHLGQRLAAIATRRRVSCPFIQHLSEIGLSSLQFCCLRVKIHVSCLLYVVYGSQGGSPLFSEGGNIALTLLTHQA